jgi:predicted ribosomally synthesized peptide with SipW-like signal peptide
MSDQSIELTRRKILGSLGAVGAAGAAAGYGTSALFSDTESFENNQITAGELDLKVDWEEHYSFPQLYGDDDPTAGEGIDSTVTAPGEDGYKAFPPGINEAEGSPLLWVHENDVGDYMDNTAIDAFPDPDGDGVQETDGSDDDEVDDDFTYNPCEDGADLNTGEGDRGLSSSLRTESEQGDPLISLNDVKPGDFGEVTLSTHLCDNDGYLSLCGELVEASENGVTEPEGASDDEVDGEVELLDEVQTALWYDDNGNNLVDPEAEELDLVVAVDRSGSIESDQQQDLIDAGNDLANGLASQADVFGSDADIQVGLLTFGDGTVDIPENLGPADPFFTSNSAGNADLGQYLDPGRSSIEYTGNTPMAAALLAADEHVRSGDNARSGAEKSVILVTDGGPNYDKTSYSVSVSEESDFMVSWMPNSGPPSEDPAPSGEGSGEVNEGELRDTATQAGVVRGNMTEIIVAGILDSSEATAGDPESNLVSNSFYNNLNNYLEDQIASSFANFFNTNFDDIGDIASLIATQVATGDEVFFTGTLRDALSTLDGCIPLDGAGDTTEFDEVDDTADARDPFDASTTYFFGFSWWVPRDVGNQIQSDTVKFNLGFQTVQARNNDGGTGNAPDL